MTLLHERTHISEEEREQENSYVRTVHVCIGHADNSVVTDLGNVEIVKHSAAERGYHGFDFLVFENSVHSRFFHVQNFTPERKNRLKTSVPALLCRSACGISLHEIDLAKFGVLFGTVGKFSGESRGFERRFSRGFSRAFSRKTLVENFFGERRVLLEIGA